MTEEAVSVEVTQADRNAAANAWRFSGVGTEEMLGAIKAGALDNHTFVQTFARHRLAALSPRPVSTGEEVERLRERIAGAIAEGHRPPDVSRETWMRVRGADFRRDADAVLATLSSDRPSPVEGE